MLRPESSEGISSTYTWSTSGIGCLFAFWCLLFPGLPLSESKGNFPPACRAVSQTASDPEPKVHRKEVLRPGVKQRAELSVCQASIATHTVKHTPTLSALSGGLVVTADFPT